MRSCDCAFDLRERARQQRHAGRAAVPRQAVEAVVAFAREAIRELALLRRKHVDAEVRRRAKGVDHRHRVAEADQDQRRIERDRSEGADGQAVRRALARPERWPRSRRWRSGRTRGGIRLRETERPSLDMWINSILSCG